MPPRVTRPRQVLPNQYYLLTRRCTQQQFLLRPDDDINNAIAYCLAVTAARCNITVLLATVESNHHHTVIYDRDGTCPQFLENFHKLVARCINARYGRTENVWASVEPCVTVLLDHETVLAKLAYTAANPVQDRLVERAVQWPGLNGYRHLLANRPLRATRPRFFFKRDGAMPAEATLEFTIPPELGKREDVIIELRERVEAIERATKASRAGARVLGVRSVLAEDWRQCTRQAEKPGGAVNRMPSIRPRFAGQREVRTEALIQFRDFLASYREARERWLAGRACVFPTGTYWMAKFTPMKNTRTVN